MLGEVFTTITSKEALLKQFPELETVTYEFKGGPLTAVGINTLDSNSFDNDSLVVSDLDELFAIGINCQLFIHLILQEVFLRALPGWYRSSEIFWDPENKLKVVAPSESVLAGDIVLLRKLTKVVDPKTFHLGIILQSAQHVLDAQVAHIAYQTEKIEVTSLRKIMKRKVHQHLMGIRRVV